MKHFPLLAIFNCGRDNQAINGVISNRIMSILSREIATRCGDLLVSFGDYREGIASCAERLNDDFIEWCQLSEIIPIPSVETTCRGFQRAGSASERQFSMGVAVSEFATRRRRVRFCRIYPAFLPRTHCVRRNLSEPAFATAAASLSATTLPYATTTGSGSWRCNFRAAGRARQKKRETERGREGEIREV